MTLKSKNKYNRKKALERRHNQLITMYTQKQGRPNMESLAERERRTSLRTHIEFARRVYPQSHVMREYMRRTMRLRHSGW